MGLVTKKALVCDRCGEALPASDVLKFIVSGESDVVLLKAIAELSIMMAEREELMAEREWLKRRIAEEDARLANA